MVASPKIRDLFKEDLINEDFCALARRELFLNANLIILCRALKNMSHAARGPKRPLISASLIIVTIFAC
jgi:hypothetical protein